MTAPQTEARTDPQSIIAALQQRLDAALARETTLAEELAVRTAELAARKTEFDERIEHQVATIDVLKAMSASPGDAQPVFDLITRRAQEVCNRYCSWDLRMRRGLDPSALGVRLQRSGRPRRVSGGLPDGDDAWLNFVSSHS